MRILQIVPQMKMGGVETGTLDLACELVRLGHSAFVVSAGGPLVQSLEKVGVRHIELPVHRKSLWSIWSSSRALKRIIQNEKIEIVHARSRAPAWVAWLAVRGTSARFVTTAHGYYRPHWGSRVMGWGERVIAVSEAIREHLLHNFGVSNERIRLIPRGVDLKKFPFYSKSINFKTPHIGILGRITPLKGHEFFLMAMKEVIKTFPDAKGFVIGDAPASKQNYYQGLLKLRENLGLSSYVDFLPGTQNVYEAMKDLDLLVLATTTPEAFGRVLVEAQAVGVPVIATRVGGVVDIIEHRKNGWLVPPQDAQTLAEQMIQVLKNPESLSSVIQEARHSVEEKFNLNLMVKRTLEVYEELLKIPRILVIKSSALGDVILASPTFRALKKNYPNSHVSLLVQEAYQKVVEHCPYLEEKIIFPKKVNLKSFFKLLHEIKIRRFDILIDLQNNEKSHLLGFLSRIPVRVGFGRQGRGFLLTHHIPYQKDVGPIESQNRLLQLLGISHQDVYLEMWNSPQQKEWVEDFFKVHQLSSSNTLIALFPFSNVRWQTKRWGFEHFRELAKLVSQRLKAIPVFIGGKEDEKDAQELLSGLEIKYLNLIGQLDLGVLSEFLRRCQLWIGGDSAPLHLAAAVGTPAIALFGPTEPLRHVPPGNVKVLTHPVPCAPCYSPICKIVTHDCLEKISVNQVFQEIQKIIKHEDCPV